MDRLTVLLQCEGLMTDDLQLVIHFGRPCDLVGFGVNTRFLLGTADRAPPQARPLSISLTKTVTQPFRAVCEIRAANVGILR